MKTLTKSELQELKSDWIGDRNSSYVFQTQNNRLGWENTLSTDASYSDFLLKTDNMSELIASAYKIADDMLVAMELPQRVHPRLTSTSAYAVDGAGTVNIPTDFFESEYLTNGQKMDIFMGYTIHEGLHVLYTYPEEPFNYPMGYDTLTLQVSNILEDERIERKCGQTKPGLVNFLGELKKFTWELSAPYLGDNPLEQLMNLLIRIIRYPKDIDDSLFDAYGYYLKQIKKVLTPFPKTRFDVGRASASIRSIIDDLYKDLENDKSNEETTSSNTSTEENENKSTSRTAGVTPFDSGDEESDNEDFTLVVDDDKQSDNTENSSPNASKNINDSNDTQPTESTPKTPKNDGENDSTELNESSDSQQTENESESGENTTDSDGEGGGEDNEQPDLSVVNKGTNINDDMDSFNKKIRQANLHTNSVLENSEAEQRLGENQIAVAVCVSDHSEFLAKKCDGRVESGTNAESTFEHVPQVTQPKALSEYAECRSQVRRYIPVIRNALRCQSQEYQLSLHGMRNGVLDTNKLAEAFQGSPNVYIRHGLVKSKKIALVVLVDESGSMCWYEGGKLSRIESARRAVVLIDEAYGKLSNIDLYIYGHTADDYDYEENNVQLRIYREGNKTTKNSLASIDARSNNRDGLAIYETAMRVRKFTKEPALMFVISDGLPNAYNYDGKPAERHTKEMVEKVEKMGFYVQQVSITKEYDPSTMFKHFIQVENTDELAIEMAKAIKKVALKETESSIIL